MYDMYVYVSSLVEVFQLLVAFSKECPLIQLTTVSKNETAQPVCSKKKPRGQQVHNGLKT